MANYEVKDGIGIIPEGTSQIKKLGFYGCKDLTTVNIPDSVTEIGEGAFNGCASLTSITIPASVKKIGHEIFSGCSSLTQIIVEEGNEYYDSRENCNAIIGPNDVLIAGCSTTSIPKSVKKIAENAFISCSELTDITIPEGVTKIGERSFSFCTSLTNISIPESVKVIGRGAFQRCESLTNITIPEGIIKLYEFFRDCKALTSILIPSSVKEISPRSFSGCSSLTTITLPEGIQIIGESTFWGCKALENITIPEGVETIENDAFSRCESLKSITLPASLKKIHKSAFEDCKAVTTINVPAKKADFFKKRLPEFLHPFVVEMDAPATKPAKKAKAPKKVTPKKEELTQAQIDALNNTYLTLYIDMDGDDASERDYENTYEVEFRNGKFFYESGNYSAKLTDFDIYETDQEGNPVVHTDEISSFIKILIKRIAHFFRKSHPFKIWGLEEYHIKGYYLKDSDFNIIDEDDLDIDIETNLR